MPGYNQTGPMGDGPATGKGMGYSNGTEPAFDRRLPGPEGFSRSMRRGRGNRCGFGSDNRGLRPRRFARRQPANVGEHKLQDPVSELDMLKKQAESMQSNLEIITKRMQDLEKKAND